MFGWTLRPSTAGLLRERQQSLLLSPAPAWVPAPAQQQACGAHSPPRSPCPSATPWLSGLSAWTPPTHTSHPHAYRHTPHRQHLASASRTFSSKKIDSGEKFPKIRVQVSILPRRKHTSLVISVLHFSSPGTNLFPFCVRESVSCFPSTVWRILRMGEVTEARASGGGPTE